MYYLHLSRFNATFLPACLLVLLAFVNTTFGQTNSQAEPLSTDAQRFDYLVKAQRYVPDLFIKARVSFSEALKILKKQNTIRKNLDPKLKKFKKSQTHPMQVTISLSQEPSEEKDYSKTHESFENFVSNLKASLLNSSTDLESARQIMSDLSTSLSEPLRHALAGSLSDSKREQLFMSSVEEQVRILEEYAPSHVAIRNPQGLGLNSFHEPKEKVIQKYLKSLSIEKHATEVALIELLTDASDLGWNPTLIRKRLDQLTFEDISSRLTNLMSLRRSIEAHLKQYWPPGKLQKRTISRLLVLVQNWIKDKNLPRGYIRNPQKSMVWEEVPSLDAIRGEFGDDGNFESAPGYAESPMERVFYLKDEKGPKAYLQGTSVLTDQGLAAFYIHTINGLRLNSEETLATLEGFRIAAPKLGYVSIELPVISILRNQINYRPIYDAFASVIQDFSGSDKLITFQDAAVRKVIGKYSASRRYDDPQMHTRAHTIRSKINLKTIGLEIKVDQANQSLFHSDISSAEYLRTFAIMTVHGESSLVESILNDLDLRMPHLESELRLILNEDGLSVESFRSRLVRFFPNDLLAENNFQFFDMSFLSCPDFTKSNDASERMFRILSRVPLMSISKNGYHLVQKRFFELIDNSPDFSKKVERTLNNSTRSRSDLSEAKIVASILYLFPEDSSVEYFISHAWDPNIRFLYSESEELFQFFHLNAAQSVPILEINRLGANGNPLMDEHARELLIGRIQDIKSDYASKSLALNSYTDLYDARQKSGLDVKKWPYPWEKVKELRRQMIADLQSRSVLSRAQAFYYLDRIYGLPEEIDRDKYLVDTIHDLYEELKKTDNVNSEFNFLRKLIYCASLKKSLQADLDGIVFDIISKNIAHKTNLLLDLNEVLEFYTVDWRLTDAVIGKLLMGQAKDILDTDAYAYDLLTLYQQPATTADAKKIILWNLEHPDLSEAEFFESLIVRLADVDQDEYFARALANFVRSGHKKSLSEFNIRYKALKILNAWQDPRTVEGAESLLSEVQTQKGIWNPKRVKSFTADYYTVEMNRIISEVRARDGPNCGELLK